VGTQRLPLDQVRSLDAVAGHGAVRVAALVHRDGEAAAECRQNVQLPVAHDLVRDAAVRAQASAAEGQIVEDAGDQAERRVGDRARILGLEIIDILGRGGAGAGDAVRGGEGGVPVAGPGKGGQQVEPARGALLRLDQQRVILCMRGAHEEVDGGELGKGAQGLGAGDRCLAQDARAPRHVDRVGHLVAQRSSLAEIGRVELVDIDRRAARGRWRQVRRSGADVAHVQRNLPGKLPLEIDGELLHARRLVPLVVAGHRIAGARQQPGRIAGRPLKPGRKWIAQRVGRGLVVVRAGHVVIGLRVARRQRRHRIVADGSVQDAVAAAHHGPGIGLPGRP